MLISIIIPCYNVAAYLPECIDSVMAQSYHEIEIILVNNNSTDDTQNILQVYQEKYPSIIKTYTEREKGAPATRNKGLSMAKGEWVQFLDADDILLTDKLKQQVDLIHKSPESDLVISHYWYQLSPSKKLKMEYAKDDLWLAFLQNKLGITSCYLWRREITNQVGGWREDLDSSQEYELLFEFLKVDAQIIFDPNCSTLVRRQKNSISTSTNPSSIWATLIDQRLRVKDFLSTNKPDYFRTNQVKIERAIVEHLSKYGLYDLKKATDIFHSAIQTKPKLIHPTNGRFHQWSYNLLGFRWGAIAYKGYLNLLRKLNRYDY